MTEANNIPMPGLLPCQRVGRIRKLLSEARVASDTMRDPEMAGPTADAATARYVGAVDSLAAELGALETVGLLAEFQRRLTPGISRPEVAL